MVAENNVLISKPQHDGGASCTHLSSRTACYLSRNIGQHMIIEQESVRIDQKANSSTVCTRQVKPSHWESTSDLEKLPVIQRKKTFCYRSREGLTKPQISKEGYSSQNEWIDNQLSIDFLECRRHQTCENGMHAIRHRNRNWNRSPPACVIAITLLTQQNICRLFPWFPHSSVPNCCRDNLLKELNSLLLRSLNDLAADLIDSTGIQFCASVDEFLGFYWIGSDCIHWLLDANHFCRLHSNQDYDWSELKVLFEVKWRLHNTHRTAFRATAVSPVLPPQMSRIASISGLSFNSRIRMSSMIFHWRQQIHKMLMNNSARVRQESL
jgi:hypothetical protein